MERACPFCQQVLCGTNFYIDEFLPEVGNEYLTLCETDNFVVAVDLAPLTEGHCLILSKEHRLAFADLPQPELSELQELLIKIQHALRREYAISPICFEHGSRGYGNSAGACIDHAHIHILPIDVAVFSALNRLLASTKISGIADVAKNINPGSGYLYYERENECYAITKNEVERQFLRKMFALTLDSDIWKWDEMIEIHNSICRERITKTRDRLFSVLSCDSRV